MASELLLMSQLLIRGQQQIKMLFRLRQEFAV
jgi:hypothetical protein